jgi:hypothetical protein
VLDDGQPGHMKKIDLIYYLFPRLKDVVFLIVFLGVLILGNQMINADGDLPRHLATGRLILETGRAPLAEPFVYPYLGNPYVPHEWLFGVLSFLIYELFGLTGIVLACGLVVAAAFTLLFDYLSKKEESYFPIFLLVIWGAVASSLHWITRPHMFTMLFLVIWLVWMDQLRRGAALHLWKFLLLMLLWCNMHAEFIMGILVTIAFLAGWVIEKLAKNTPDAKQATGKNMLIVLAASLPVTLINPAFYQPWLRVIRYLGNDYLMSTISETVTPDFHRAEFLVLLALIIFSIILLVRSIRKVSWAERLLLAGVTLLTLTSARSVHLYGIVVPFTLAGAVSDLKGIPLVVRIEGIIKSVERRLRVYSAAALVVLVSLSALIVGRWGGLYQFDRSTFPVEAVAWLNENPQTGHVFNDFNWGGYLIMYLKPDQPVFIDSMADHSGDLTREYSQAIGPAGDWQAIFEKYQVGWVILPVNTTLGATLQNTPGWDVIYSDGTAIVISRDIN